MHVAPLFYVIPAEAGIHVEWDVDSRVRGNARLGIMVGYTTRKWLEEEGCGGGTPETYIGGWISKTGRERPSHTMGITLCKRLPGLDICC